MNVEEEGVETEYVPEWARARLLEVSYYEDEKVRTVRTACIRGVGEDAELKFGNWSWKSVNEGVGTSNEVLKDLVIFEADPGVYVTVE